MFVSVLKCRSCNFETRKAFIWPKHIMRDWQVVVQNTKNLKIRTLWFDDHDVFYSRDEAAIARYTTEIIDRAKTKNEQVLHFTPRQIIEGRITKVRCPKCRNRLAIRPLGIT